MSKKIIVVIILVAVVSIFVALSLFTPSPESKKEISTPLLKLHKVYVVYKYNRHPPVAHIIGEGLDGKTFNLPEEFNEMIIREKMTVDTEEKAYGVAMTYVNSSITFGHILILKNLSDIPKMDTNEDLSSITNVIKPPYSVKTGSDFFVRLYSWREIGGYVEEWSFNISRDGRVSVKRDEIASKIGAFRMLQ